MNNIILLTPETVTVAYDVSSHQLTICVSGIEDSIHDITIEKSIMPIEPPVFRVIRKPSPDSKNFPYNLETSFNFAQNPQTIVLQTSVGDKEYYVGKALQALF